MIKEEKWYRSVHGEIFSVLQISAVVFVITAIVVFLIIHVPLSYFVDDYNSSGNLSKAPVLFLSILAGGIAAYYAIGSVLYKIRFAKNGIAVRNNIFGRESTFNITYENIQFIQVYTRKSTVRHNPKVIIVIDENSKYEVMLANDAEGEEILNIVPEELIKKIM